MEHVLTSHGALAWGLFAVCGSITGLKSGLWAVGLFCSVCAVGVMTLSLWENREEWFDIAQLEKRGAMTSVPIIMQRTATRMRGKR